MNPGHRFIRFRISDGPKRRLRYRLSCGRGWVSGSGWVLDARQAAIFENYTAARIGLERHFRECHPCSNFKAAVDNPVFCVNCRRVH